MATHTNLFRNLKRNISLFAGSSLQKSPPGRAVIKWQALEFYMVDKSIVWGMLVSLFFVTLAGLFALFNQVLLAVITLLFMFVVLKFAYAEPKTIEYRVEEIGIRISGWLHPYYIEIIAFWIGRQGNQQTLYLQTRNIFADHLSIPIKDVGIKKCARINEVFNPNEIIYGIRRFFGE